MTNADGLTPQPSCLVAESDVEWVEWGEPWDGDPEANFVQRRRDAEESYRMNEGMLASPPPADAGLAVWHHAENVSAFLEMALTARFLYSVELGLPSVEVLDGCGSWATAIIQTARNSKWMPYLRKLNLDGGAKSELWDFPYADLFSVDIEPRAHEHLQRLTEKALGCAPAGTDFAEVLHPDSDSDERSTLTMERGPSVQDVDFVDSKETRSELWRIAQKAYMGGTGRRLTDPVFSIDMGWEKQSTNPRHWRAFVNKTHGETNSQIRAKLNLIINKYTVNH